MASNVTNTKKRNWTFVLYPESAPEGWLEKLKQSGVMAAVSPLHDKDTNADGEPKKAHHHVLLVYSGPTTFKAVSSFTASFNATIPQALESVRGMYRYFTHLDNPEKYQYQASEIINLNGFNINDLVELSKSEVNELKKRVFSLIREVELVEYHELLDFLLDNGMDAEADIAMNNTLLFNTYLTSQRYAQQRREDELGRVAAAQAKARMMAERSRAKQEAEAAKAEAEPRTPFD